MVTFSSTPLNSVAVAFLVQDGIATWESDGSLDDSRWSTVSVVGSQLRHVIPILWTLIEARPSNGKVVHRIHVSGLPEMATRTLRRNLMVQLSADLPGFRDTHAHVGESKLCVISKLAESSAVDPRSMTFYRYTALIETDDDTFVPSELCNQLCRDVAALDREGIAWLLACYKRLGLFRVLDLETHAVVQFIGWREAVGNAVRLLVDRRFNQVSDIDDIHKIIDAFRN